MKKILKQQRFTWICNRCNYSHTESFDHVDVRDSIVKLVCNQCGGEQQNEIVDLQENRILFGWGDIKCHQCIENSNCLSSDIPTKFNERLQKINKLGFCEDYEIDPSILLTDKKQMCQKNMILDELYNNMIDEGEGL